MRHDSVSTHTRTDETLRINAELSDSSQDILSEDALQFLALLEQNFGSRRKLLLQKRALRRQEMNRGSRPNFIKATSQIRESDWHVASPPADLVDRRVEITGPVDRKMIINALNSGANVFMADFEDSNAPTWSNCISGQINLRDAVRRTIDYRNPKTGKEYRLGKDTATLCVRPRGWHLTEGHALASGSPMSASLFDFGLFLFHNAHELTSRGSGPYFYLPKLESHLEARLWRDVFRFSEGHLGLKSGTIRVTVLIETLLAAFEMDEILYELKDYITGLNCGRWDYIFSYIKCLGNDAKYTLPDRSLVSMDQHFLQSYSRLLIETCHRRGAHAMGGMAAQIPIKNDDARNARALAAVRADKRREAKDGHDGTWVAHPALVAIAKEEFDKVLLGKNQLDRPLTNMSYSQEDLLRVPQGPITLHGLKTNISVGLRYIESWLRGQGCVPIDGLMEDAATAEISRSQVWQWLRHEAVLEGGETITPRLVQNLFTEFLKEIRLANPKGNAPGRFKLAAQLFLNQVLARTPHEFITLIAYQHITSPFERPTL